MSRSTRLHPDSQDANAEPFSDLEVYNVEHSSTENLHSRLSFAPEPVHHDGPNTHYTNNHNGGYSSYARNCDGPLPNHPIVGRYADSNGLVLVNEQNLGRSTISEKSKKKVKQHAFGRFSRDWTFRERKAVRLFILVLTILIIGGVLGGVFGSRKRHSGSNGRAAHHPAIVSASQSSPTSSTNLITPTSLTHLTSSMDSALSNVTPITRSSKTPCASVPRP